MAVWLKYCSWKAGTPNWECASNDALLIVSDDMRIDAARERLGANARAFAQANYDLKTVCLPRQLEWVEGLVK